jgi:hypothetical protein
MAVFNPYAVELSNGTLVAGREMANGATEAVIIPEDREMTESEWQEFCLYLRSLTSDQLKMRMACRMKLEHHNGNVNKMVSGQ